MNVKNLIFLCSLFLCYTAFGQVTDKEEVWYKGEEEVEEVDKKPEYFWSYQRELGLNFSPLISKIVPFNLGDPDAGFSNFSFKKYGRKFAFRINAGIDFDDEDDESGFALLTLGFERRRQITKKVTLATGMDFGIFGFFDDDPFLNISFLYGFEYNINEKLYLSTEANIQFLMGNGSQLRVNPPVAIFFYVRI